MGQNPFLSLIKILIISFISINFLIPKKLSMGLIISAAFSQEESREKVVGKSDKSEKTQEQNQVELSKKKKEHHILEMDEDEIAQVKPTDSTAISQEYITIQIEDSDSDDDLQEGQKANGRPEVLQSAAAAVATARVKHPWARKAANFIRIPFVKFMTDFLYDSTLSTGVVLWAQDKREGLNSIGAMACLGGQIFFSGIPHAIDNMDRYLNPEIPANASHGNNENAFALAPSYKQRLVGWLVKKVSFKYQDKTYKLKK